MTVNWARGNGQNVLVVARQGSPVNADPVNGVTYTANAAFGSGTQIGTGNYVVYKGTGTSAVITSLLNNTTYHYALYEFDGSGGAECYRLSDKLTGNATTLIPGAQFYRSAGSGNWHNTSTWQSSTDNNSWVAASFWPTNSDNTITIRSGHTVTIGDDVTIDQTIVESGATLVYSSGTLSIANGSGDDLTVFGTFRHSASSGFPLSSGATIRVKENATLELTTTPSGASSYGTDGGMQYENHATFFWNSGNATAFTSSGVTYFPNAGPSVVPIFRVNATNPSVGASGTTTINGIFQVDGAVTWQNSGAKIFRNGITGGGTVTQASNSGPFQITGSAASIAPGTLTLNTGGLGISGTVTLDGNETITGGTVTVTGGGILDCGAHTVGGSTNFTLAANATLITANANGVSGSITATGTKTYSPDANYEFRGAQTGTFHPTAANVTINRSSGVTLTNPLTINGTLTFTSGKLTLGGNTLTMGASGSIAGASGARYLVTNGGGKLKRNNVGPSSVSFPIGNASYYTPVSILNTGAQADNFSVSFAQAYPNCITPGTQQNSSVVGTWDIEEDTPGGSFCVITIEYGDVPKGSNFNSGDAGIARCNGPDITYFNRSTGTSTSVTGDGFTAFSPFAVGNAAALPIELLSFEVQKAGATALLTWRTASEINNAFMAIERSADGIRFEEIGRIPGAGTVYEPRDYRFTDQHPLPGFNYYRLRQEDFDGTIHYHKIVVIEFPALASQHVQLFPNPAREMLSVRFAAAAPSDRFLLVTGLQGNILQRAVLPRGSIQTDIPLQGLPAGMYFLRLEGESALQRFVKEK